MKLDTIQLNGGSGPPASLADGEFYIDEAAQLLYVATLAGIQAIPLAVQALPPLPGDRNKVVLKSGASTSFGVLSAGGGGRTFDDQPWRVPGLVPLDVGTKTLVAGEVHYALFELSAAQTLSGLRVTMTVAGGAYVAGVCAWDPVAGQPGAVQVMVNGGGVGAQTMIASKALTPGVYATFLKTTTGGTAQAISGTLRGGRLHANRPAAYAGAGNLVMGAQAPAWTDFDSSPGYPVALKFL